MRLVLSDEVATTLGDLRKFTLGGEGAGRWVGRRDGGASVHHDSKISWREVIALSWETLVGGGALQIDGAQKISISAHSIPLVPHQA